MSKILELRQKRAEAWDKAKAFLDEHTSENGVMSAEDSQQYERMEQEVVDLGHTIDRMERTGEFPQRFWITDKRCAWNAEEVENWLDERQATSPTEFTGKKPPVDQRVYRPVSNAA